MTYFEKVWNWVGVIEAVVVVFGMIGIIVGLFLSDQSESNVNADLIGTFAAVLIFGITVFFNSELKKEITP